MTYLEIMDSLIQNDQQGAAYILESKATNNEKNGESNIKELYAEMITNYLSTNIELTSYDVVYSPEFAMLKGIAIIIQDYMMPIVSSDCDVIEFILEPQDYCGMSP